MLISKWRERSHRHFGAIFVPMVEIELGLPGGALHSFSLCADSGAVISLLPRAGAVVLGVNWAEGRPIQLGGVGGTGIDARVHDLQLRIDDGNSFVAPFAIAVHEDVPALLGRQGIFDRCDITFDARQRVTHIQVA